MVGRQDVGDAIGPFDETDAGGLEIFLGPQVDQFAGIVQAVGVEVINRPSSRVLVDEDERGAADLAPIDAGRLGDGPNQPRLARSQISYQRDDGPRYENVGQGGAETARRFFVRGGE